MTVVPIGHWLPKYRRADFRFDLMAAITVAALGIRVLRLPCDPAGVLVEPGARIELATT
jgi:MFS superfamily sulfate permease-like transporter